MAFENFGKVISNIASTTAKKAEEQAKITKLGLDRAGVERRIESVYTAMGRFCYNKYKNGEQLPEDLLEYCRDIDTLSEQIDSLNGEIELHKNERDSVQYDVSMKADSANSVYVAESDIAAEETYSAEEIVSTEEIPSPEQREDEQPKIEFIEE